MTNLKAPTLVDVVVRHEQEIQELKRLVTPMMEFGRDKHTAKCAVKDCENRMGQGYFNGFLCSPCHRFVSGEEGVYSQAYRNSRKMIDAAIEMERSKKEWVGLTSEYICTCGIRVTPHKCPTDNGF